MEKKKPKHFEIAEIIKKIESYGAKYNPDSDLLAHDQLLIREAISEATLIEKNWKPKKKPRDKSLELRDKRLPTNTEQTQGLTQSKHRIITDLRNCNYRTPTYKIAFLLKELLGPARKATHWDYIAENWHPKAINQVINYILKREKNGLEIKDFGDFFTWLIKRKKRRKKPEWG